MAAGESYVLPEYGGGCITNVVPALLDWPDQPLWLPAEARAERTVLLLLDGLGWDQLCDRRSLAPCMSSMQGGPILTIAPSTTAAALTSVTTGLPPGEHGIVGYRMLVEHEVLNVLRWSTPAGDARRRLVPGELQPELPFEGQRPPVVTRAEFVDTGFTHAHLAGVRFKGYRVTSSLVTQVVELVEAGEPFVYAYYEGVDKVAHEYGLGRFYDAELAAADRIVSDLLDQLPAGTALVVTADHGQLETGEMVEPHPSVLAHTAIQSGEGRFRWLHARPGRAAALLEAAIEHHSGHAWVRTRDDVVKEGWFGPRVTDAAASRLGDVALVAQGDIAFHDPADSGPFRLVGRHGSLTSAEMRVPLLAARA
ncbi:MAG: PglZ domain-containing protein [Acidimicrobiia bacterium]|nr:PglZ domain-containing protein [Acidimicrobiia bacterium]